MHQLLAKVYIIFFLVVFLSLNVQADNTKVFKLHTVHFNAFPSDSLPPEMTQRYHLKRSKNIALINVSIIKNAASIPFQGVASTVNGVLKNLMGQEVKLSFQEIHEGTAYYYIAQVAVEHNDIVNFKIQIKTSDNADYQLSFRKQFGTR
ncbi:MAG: DUF4426 domain-containing protein [Pseudomonadota bacterium]